MLLERLIFVKHNFDDDFHLTIFHLLLHEEENLCIERQTTKRGDFFSINSDFRLFDIIYGIRNYFIR